MILDCRKIVSHYDRKKFSFPNRIVKGTSINDVTLEGGRKV